MKLLSASLLCTLGLALTPAIAQAQGQPAVTAKQVNLRAGPARDFPLVAILQTGYPISVLGCVEDYTWCDVLAADLRGWVYAGNISYAYQGNYVPLVDYAPLIGIGILGFALNDYWGNNYRNRPFYRDRDRWSNFRPPPPRPRPDWNRPGGRPDWNRPDRPNRPDWNRPDRPDRPDRPGRPDRPDRPDQPPQGGGSGWQPPPGTMRPAPQPQRPAPIARPQVQAVPQPAPQAPPQGGGSGWTPPVAPRPAPQAAPAQPQRQGRPAAPEPRDRGNAGGDPGATGGGGSGWQRP